MNAERARAIRLVLGLTTKAMAERLDLTQRQIQRMEAGDANVTRRTARQYEQLLAKHSREKAEA